MEQASAASLVEEATFEFTMGEAERALELLDKACALDAACVEAWHARAEVLFAQDRLHEALEAGQIAVSLREEDVHLHTTLSRIHMELGDKETAEKHGARARVLGWKATLQGEEE